MNSFANLVSSKINEQKFSLRKVAKEAGLDPSFLSKVLQGKRSPPSNEKILKKLAKFLGIDPTLLIISTGKIPSELQPLMENPAFLKSLSKGILTTSQSELFLKEDEEKKNKTKETLKARPEESKTDSAKQSSQEARPLEKKEQPLFIQKSTLLSEDLL